MGWEGKMNKVKKGDLVLVHFFDHSLEHKGSKKDDKIMDIYVTGKLTSQQGKQILVDTWWLSEKGMESNHERAKILKSAIINIWRLKIQ